MHSRVPCMVGVQFLQGLRATNSYTWVFVWYIASVSSDEVDMTSLTTYIWPDNLQL
jgi:hypothetical protein